MNRGEHNHSKRTRQAGNLHSLNAAGDSKVKAGRAACQSLASVMAPSMFSTAATSLGFSDAYKRVYLQQIEETKTPNNKTLNP